MGGNDIDDRGLERVACRPDRPALHIDRLDAAGELRRQPFDHPRIVALPCLLEEILLFERVLGVEDRDSCLGLVLLEIGGDEEARS